MIGLRGIPARATGVEKAVEELAVRLVARGHRVTVYCRRRYCDGRPSERGVDLRYPPAVYTKHLEAIAHTAFSVADVLGRRFDIVHFHALGPSLFAAMPRLGGARTVATVHGLDWRRGKWGPFARLVLRVGQSAAARLPDHTLVVSRSLLRHFSTRYPAGRFSYVPNGVVAAAPAPPGAALERLGLAARGYVLSVSRLVPEKGVHTLIEAYRKVRTAARLVVVGGGSYSDRYVRALHEAAQGDPRVVFTGPLFGGNKAEVLANSLCYVNPSTLEGLSLALLEAMGAGVPVVVSDIAGNLEAITDHETGGRAGTWFRSGSADALAEALAHVLAYPESLVEPARRARDIVARAYDWDSITEQTEAVYRSVLRGPAVTSPPRR